jgi:hypothetical protein
VAKKVANPLNVVNYFSEINGELAGGMKNCNTHENI